jgi:hypothetical protein
MSVPKKPGIHLDTGLSLVAQRTVGTADVPVNCVRMYVHTGGCGLESIAVWKQLFIRANEVRTRR